MFKKWNKVNLNDWIYFSMWLMVYNFHKLLKNCYLPKSRISELLQLQRRAEQIKNLWLGKMVNCYPFWFWLLLASVICKLTVIYSSMQNRLGCSEWRRVCLVRTMWFLCVCQVLLWLNCGLRFDWCPVQCLQNKELQLFMLIMRISISNNNNIFC